MSGCLLAPIRMPKVLEPARKDFPIGRVLKQIVHNGIAGHA